MAPMAVFDMHSEFAAPVFSFDDFLNYLSAIFWTSDICMSFCTAYHSSAGILETRISAIAVHYLKTWFPIDSSIVAVDWSLIAIVGTGNGFLRLTKTASRIMRIARLLRLVKMSKHVGELMARINSEYVLQIIGLLRLLLVILLLNHYIACFWFAVSAATTSGRSWVDTHLIEKGYVDLEYAYLSCLHWSLTQFTPASMEIFPKNVFERMFNVVVILFAFVFFSSFVSSITSAMTHIRNINAKAVARDTMIRKYFSENNIPHGLAARVWHFVRHQRVAAQRKLRTDQVDIFAVLPVRIRDELKCEVWGPIIMKHPMMTAYLAHTPQAIRKICKKAIEEKSLDTGGEYRCDGEVKKMIYITGGLLEFHMSDALELEDEDVVGLILESGEWCCEAALWADKVHLDGHFIATSGGADLVLVDAEVFRAVAFENYETVDMLVKYSTRFMETFRHAMLDPKSVHDNLLFNNPDVLRELAADVTSTVQRRSLLTPGFSFMHEKEQAI
eukprot:CAMPEP_0204526816 /NCGR_PEP_ID=MMETSP0661-20131031/8642_1 /ASSEMBLY_ACC=CAM_ASM_000606 /TAXON_ID=109239 /ORGANISM="Alexandrium margalefi, Strain AMGDE01CS-322" /LENGTH=500 /DNA_ID=CAMNT_0051532677 /DNA_START=63 /DNA_END=1565 /DNA_ORIENTATION=-